MMQTFHVAIGGKTYKVALDRDGGAGVGGVTVDGVAVAVDARELEAGVLSLLVTEADGSVRSLKAIAEAGESTAVTIQGQRFEYALTDPRSLRAASAGAGGDSGPKALKAPMPGRVVRVLVAVGETVAAGQGCVVIEAMKMQNELKAPKGGVVGKLSAVVGETVGSGATLLVVE